IDPSRAAISSLAFGAAVLKDGQNVIWYPEGQRSLTGELQPFKPGIGVLLHEYRVPVVPVFLQGTYQALPPGRILPHLEQITVRFGPPLDPRRLEQEAEGDEPHERIARALHDHVAELSENGRARGLSHGIHFLQLPSNRDKVRSPSDGSED